MTRDPDVDAANAEFWSELCGTGLAVSIGATGRTPEDLRRFDQAFLDFYPYLAGYLPTAALHGASVLEIGLGYGTLGTLLIEQAGSYTGVDISPGPVAMMNYRIALAGRAESCTALEASALSLPFDEGDFDFVYTIGCLHHTGDLARAVDEVRRVLRPGGRAVVMLYNRWSARRIRAAPRRALTRLLHEDVDGATAERARYDSDQAGNAPPHTDFVSARRVRELFRDFASVRVDRRNLDMGRLPTMRPRLLAIGLDRIVGLDLYVRATR